ncbi:Nucleotide-binding universal stress protein, UspA family [Saccharicrinis carchari]|uniref:Nucleotide-binding universal stress protein, UspA family n=1 Tax=Saccharicrinis carchari TaxID=1168039 RepID=A0A521CMV1_SACCC|nr:universal stress protein [Saccharicrinis carchari]SMO60705.1 Nucleotide-binding universal stress protein, UspA family [Saccharicrinis carchari]
MEKTENIILIPYDFTQVAMHAVAHVKSLSQRNGAQIYLLHIVKKDTDADEALKKLTQEKQKIKDSYGINVNLVVKEGTIFKTIKEVASEINANLVVMGTHGIKGRQKLTGSWALKVIVGSKIPFFVVQDKPTDSEVKKIVFPVDFKTENKEKLYWAQYLSSFMETKVFLFSSSTKDGVIEPRTKANLVFCKNYLEEKEINYELSLSDGKGSFAQETINFANTINADAIIIMTTRDIAFHDYILGANEQHIIANSFKVPVMVINPRTDLMKYGYGAF